MRTFGITHFAMLAVAVLFNVSSIDADHRLRSYPKVRTFSGGYYGPTQAHYQYERRYGRPWHGAGGHLRRHRHHSHGHHHHHVGYGTSGFSGFGYTGFRPYGGSHSGFYRSSSSFFGPSHIGPGFYGSGIYDPGCRGGYGWGTTPYGVTSIDPTLTPYAPGYYTPLMNKGQLGKPEFPAVVAPGVETLDVEPLGDGDAPLSLGPASTPAAQLRSLQKQSHGDQRLRNLDYLQASLRYQEAIDTAPDRADPRYRLAITQVAMKRFDKAVQSFKTATSLDPNWADSTSLVELVGDDNLIGITQLKQRAADWALKDAYDADRLYLLGMLMHLDGDANRARILLKTAAALIGDEPHLTALLGPPTLTPPAPAIMPQPPESPITQRFTNRPSTKDTQPLQPTPTGPTFPSSFD